MNTIETGDVLIRKHDYKVFYVSCCNQDGTYTVRQMQTNKLYGKFTKDQLEEVFINERQQFETT